MDMNIIDRVKYLNGLNDDIKFLQKELKKLVKYIEVQYFNDIEKLGHKENLALIMYSGKIINILGKIDMLKQLKSDLQSGIAILKYVK